MDFVIGGGQHILGGQQVPIWVLHRAFRIVVDSDILKALLREEVLQECCIGESNTGECITP